MDPLLAATSRALASSDTAFFTLFGIFVVATLVLSVITLRWAIRRDKAGRAAWRARQQGDDPLDSTP
jgi:hypothetical protein